MRFPLFLLVGFGVGACPLAAALDRSEEAARSAQALLGPDCWACVLHIHNNRPGRVYPSDFHALVFELADLLWFYTPFDGTQSLSQYRGRLAADKVSLGPLLAAIEPGLSRWEVCPETGVWPAGQRPLLPNGCFIESVATWRERLRTQSPPDAAMLLSFYGPRREGGPGHTVFVWISQGQAVVYDPDGPDRPQHFPVSLAHDPLALARELEGSSIVKARFVPLPAPRSAEANRWAGQGPDAAGHAAMPAARNTAVDAGA